MVVPEDGIEKEVIDLLCREYITQKVKLKEIISEEKRSDKKIFSATVNNIRLHITTGSNLEKTYNNTKILNQLIPELTCKPILYHKRQNSDIFIQEYFEGKKLDELIDKNEISTLELCNLISRIFIIFSSLETKSSKEDLLNEFELKTSKYVNLLSNYIEDKDLLEKYIIPLIKGNLNTDKPMKRWSPGDLCSRNILVSETEFRIIDLEFAGETHFYDEDIIRLYNFSHAKIKKVKQVQKAYEAVPKYMISYFWLRQAYISCKLYKTDGFNTISSFYYGCFVEGLVWLKNDTDRKSVIFDGSNSFIKRLLRLNDESKFLIEKVTLNNKELASKLQSMFEKLKKQKLQLDKYNIEIKRNEQHISKLQENNKSIVKRSDFYKLENNNLTDLISTIKSKRIWKKVSDYINILGNNKSLSAYFNKRYGVIFKIEDFKIYKQNNIIRFKLNGRLWCLEPLQVQAMYIQIGKRKEIVSLTKFETPPLVDNKDNHIINFSKDIKMNKGFKYIRLYLNTEDGKIILKNKICFSFSYFNSLSSIRNIYRNNKLLFDYKKLTKKYQNHEYTIKIIIPVYDDFDLTKSCIESVISTKKNNETNFSLLIINDNSPNNRINNYLQNIDESFVEIIHNSKNLGFVGAVNKGLVQTNPSDVILLNSDTLVNNDWVDRIYNYYKKDNSIGSITPLSNNATICSFPSSIVGGELPPNITFKEIDSILTNHQFSFEIPTGVGSCMFISRKALDEIGFLDEKKFGKGYGEENDLSFRLSKKGFSNILITDVYIYHKGEASFGKTSTLKKTNAAGIINCLYPNYDRIIRKSIKELSNQKFWLTLIVSFLENITTKIKIHISNNRGGGTYNYIKKNASDTKFFHILLCPISVNSKYYNLKFLFNETTYVSDIIVCDLIKIINLKNVDNIVIHQVLDHDRQIFDILIENNINYDVFLHDFYLKCPQINMSQIDNRYCNDPEASQCNICLQQRPVGKISSIYKWREFTKNILCNANNIFCPSFSTREIYLRTFNDLDIQVVYHDDSHLLKNEINFQKLSNITICIIGSISKEKGSERFLDFVSYSKLNNLPFSFICIGILDQNLTKLNYTNLLVTGEYDNKGLPSIINSYNPHVFWFPALCPETFSFTLSEVLETGIPIIASKIGSFPERLQDRSNVILHNTESSNYEISELIKKKFYMN